MQNRPPTTAIKLLADPAIPGHLAQIDFDLKGSTPSGNYF